MSERIHVFVRFPREYAVVTIEEREARLVALTRRRDVMGGLVNGTVTTAAAVIVAGVIIVLNVFLLVVTFLD